MSTNREPPITLTRDDYKTLSKLTDLRAGVAVADYLAYELDRARVVPSIDETLATVGIGSRVRFRDVESDTMREVILAMPNEADIAKAHISVLTPVGVALLGLSAGQTIAFTAPSGQERSLQVVKITPSQDGIGDDLSGEARTAHNASYKEPALTR